ncbi:MAG: prepilin-type N-terminal cleavage/methylation domain-containing protein [Opitutaceae bacterium]
MKRVIPSSRRGFTMIELIVAMVLIAGVMIGLNTFIFSMSELWGRGREYRLFDQHARSLTRFLEGELRQAALPPRVAKDVAAVEAREVEVDFGRREDLLVFGLREGSRILQWPERPLPDVWAALEVKRGEGLILYWQSALEEEFNTDPPREMVLSQLVTAMRYEYFEADFGQWEIENRLRTGDDGELETPGRIRLTFTYREQEVQTIVPLTIFGEGLPPF